MIIGFTSGVFDLFHVGHLNLLENASKHCDKLVVGVCSDKLAFKLKGKVPVFDEKARLKIVDSLWFVDGVVLKKFDNDLSIARKVKASIVFKGSDWEKSKKWKNLKVKFRRCGIDVKFFPYTNGVSSSMLRSCLK